MNFKNRLLKYIISKIKITRYFYDRKKYPSYWYNFVALQLVNNNARILDIGCGIGTLLRHISSSKHNYSLFGTDKSPRNIFLAKFLDFGKTINFCSSDIENGLHFDKQSFDLCILNDVLHYIKDKKKLILEISKILTKNGTLAFIHISNVRLGASPIFPINYINLIKLLEKHGFEHIFAIDDQDLWKRIINNSTIDFNLNNLLKNKSPNIYTIFASRKKLQKSITIPKKIYNQIKIQNPVFSGQFGNDMT